MILHLILIRNPSNQHQIQMSQPMSKGGYCWWVKTLGDRRPAKSLNSAHVKRVKPINFFEGLDLRKF